MPSISLPRFQLSWILSSPIDIEWDKEWFHKIPAHLQSFEDHKKFLDGVASTLNVRNPRDWGKVTIKHIKCLKRGHSMLRHYNHSLFVCLRTIYKGKNWFVKN